MKTPTPFLVLLLLAAAGCASSGGPESAAAPSSGPTQTPAGQPAAAAATPAPVGAASFSEAQAARGRAIFRATCTECHYSSEFSDSQFKFKWSRRSAGNLYQLIHTSMPETAPGSLSAAEAVDIVSYILSMNGFEAGADELAPDRTVLDAISLASIRNP